jgi:hypothetical protein
MVEIKTKKVVPVMQTMVCECGKEMRLQNVRITPKGQKFEYICDGCGNLEMSDKQYPFTAFMDEADYARMLVEEEQKRQATAPLIPEMKEELRKESLREGEDSQKIQEADSQPVNPKLVPRTRKESKK